ncbi:hypothetical protein G9A89_015023 [Geosiphon pyriformis]|nr:hypothetical protein G9A89_015023 [Geosiphon pyriformis]
MHLADLQAAMINARDFEAAELEVNYVQAINLMMNESSKLDSKLKQFNAQTNNSETNKKSTLISNIPPATITENKSLDAIFPFKLEEPSITLLFSGAIFEEKPITTMYTDAKVNGHPIKLILDSRLAGSIITRQLMDQLSYRVD